MIILILLMLVAIIGTTATQITHAVGVGNINFRYFLPVILVFGLFIVYGLLEVRKTRGILLWLAVIGMVASSFVTMAADKTIRLVLPYVKHINGTFSKLHYEITSNGFPGVTLVILSTVTIIGVAMLGYALFKLTEPVKQRA